MRLPLYWVDAFATRVFKGNRAAVVPLERWIPDEAMQSIAAENGLPTTAFLVQEREACAIRWFSPGREMELCGHATLAAAFVVLTRLAPDSAVVRFSSRSGPLTVVREDDLFMLDFPARPATPVEPSDALAAALGRAPVEILASGVYLAVFEREDDVRSLVPDMARTAALDLRGVIATAPGREYDFVSRFFAPKSGAPEDAVTGSAHCTLTPYWSRRLGRPVLRARQVSSRGGDLRCEDRGARVRIGGSAVLYLAGAIEV
jgi:PhzF family phenazine biosynthesis protein